MEILMTDDVPREVSGMNFPPASNGVMSEVTLKPIN